MEAAFGLAFATLASEDLAALTAGVLAGEGRVDVRVATGAVALGIYFGDLLLFLCGRISARTGVLPAWLRAGARKHDREHGAGAFEERLALTVLTSRFIPGSRLPVYVAAGMFCRRPFAFCAWTLVAVAVWTPLLVLGVYAAGDAFRTRAEWYLRWAPGIVVLITLHLLVRAFRMRRVT